MNDFEPQERARTRSEAARAARPTTGGRAAAVWQGMMRYLSGELGRQKRRTEDEHEDQQPSRGPEHR